jgi:periplasmic divalent cation tolerance protein
MTARQPDVSNWISVSIVLLDPVGSENFRAAASRERRADFYMSDKRIVLSTAGSVEEARKIAGHLVENQLAACVNIVPQIESIYRWQGKVESSSEWLLLIKTTSGNVSPVEDAIRALHSYDLPECIAIVIDAGSSKYLDWIGDSVE